MNLKDINWRAFDFIRKRKQDYQLTFSGPAGQEVLRDLAEFCRANKTCFHADPRLHAVAEGRREVWLRIQQHLKMTSEQLYSLINGQTIKLTTAEDDDNG